MFPGLHLSAGGGGGGRCLLDSGQAGPGLEPGQGGANDQRGAHWACLSPPAPQRREEVWQEAAGGGGRCAVGLAVGGHRLFWLAETVHRASQRGAGSGHVGPAILLPPPGREPPLRSGTQVWGAPGRAGRALAQQAWAAELGLAARGAI